MRFASFDLCRASGNLRQHTCTELTRARCKPNQTANSLTQRVLQLWNYLLQDIFYDASFLFTQVQKSIGDIYRALLSINQHSQHNHSLHHKQLKAGRNTSKLHACPNPVLPPGSVLLAGCGDSIVVQQFIQSALSVWYASTCPVHKGISLSSYPSFKASCARCSFASSGAELLPFTAHLPGFAGRHLNRRSWSFCAS